MQVLSDSCEKRGMLSAISDDCNRFTCRISNQSCGVVFRCCERMVIRL